MFVKNRFVFIVLTIAFGVCVLNTDIHSLCDSKQVCDDRRDRRWRCVEDLNNNHPDKPCYKAIPNEEEAKNCEKLGNGWQWHYDGRRCHNPENRSLVTVIEDTVDRILTEDTTEPDGDSEEDTDPSENTLGIDPLPQSNQPLTENPEPVPDDDTAKPEDIMITEIMVDTLGDTLPQWIELTNYSTKEVNLKGWRIRIVNKFDENAYSKSKEVYLNNIVLGSSTSEGEDDKNRVALITFRLWGLKGRKSANLDLHDIFSYDLYRGYNILSKVAFRIELIPPPTMDRSKADVAGNLPRRDLFLNPWKLPAQSTERRSSLIRRKDEGWMESKGVSIDNWILAHETELADESPSDIWYGKDDDIGTPGRVDDPMMMDVAEVPAAPTLIRKLKVATSWGSLKQENK